MWYTKCSFFLFYLPGVEEGGLPVRNIFLSVCMYLVCMHVFTENLVGFHFTKVATFTAINPYLPHFTSKETDTSNYNPRWRSPEDTLFFFFLLHMQSVSTSKNTPMAPLLSVTVLCPSIETWIPKGDKQRLQKCIKWFPGVMQTWLTPW